METLDLVSHLHRQAAFSAGTFGPGARLRGVTDHIKKELVEVVESGGALAEWVDVIILACDGAWRSGATPEQIAQAIVDKQTRNESRTWPDWRAADPNKAIEHDRSGEAPKPQRVYLSGPMSGIEDHNFPAFNAAASNLRTLGYAVVNPAEINADAKGSWQECLRKDMAALTDCDMLALLPGWQKSNGAHLELHVAYKALVDLELGQRQALEVSQ